MRKCPNCDKRTIRIFNKSFLNKSIICSNCREKVGFSKFWNLILTIVYVLWIVFYFIMNYIIEVNLSRFIIGLVISTLIMTAFQVFLIPYEKK